MSYWWAGASAAVVAWIFNAQLLRRGGDYTVVLAVPFLEEAVKTGAALFFSASVAPTHAVFGLIEAAHDIYTSRSRGVGAGLSSIASHWAFGIVTVVVYRLSGLWLLGVLAASLLHIAVNYVMASVFSHS